MTLLGSTTIKASHTKDSTLYDLNLLSKHFQNVMLCDWRVRLFLVIVFVCLYLMISSLISVTRMDAKTLAERRIHSADIMDLSGRMLGGRFDRSMMVKRNQERRRTGVSIIWCRQLGLKAAPGPVTALASFPGSGNT